MILVIYLYYTILTNAMMLKLKIHQTMCGESCYDFILNNLKL